MLINDESWSSSASFAQRYARSVVIDKQLSYYKDTSAIIKFDGITDYVVPSDIVVVHRRYRVIQLSHRFLLSSFSKKFVSRQWCCQVTIPYDNLVFRYRSFYLFTLSSWHIATDHLPVLLIILLVRKRESFTRHVDKAASSLVQFGKPCAVIKTFEWQKASVYNAQFVMHVRSHGKYGRFSFASESIIENVWNRYCACPVFFHDLPTFLRLKYPRRWSNFSTVRNASKFSPIPRPKKRSMFRVCFFFLFLFRDGAQHQSRVCTLITRAHTHTHTDRLNASWNTVSQKFPRFPRFVFRTMTRAFERARN